MNGHAATLSPIPPQPPPPPPWGAVPPVSPPPENITLHARTTAALRAALLGGAARPPPPPGRFGYADFLFNQYAGFAIPIHVRITDAKNTPRAYARGAFLVAAVTIGSAYAAGR